MADIDLRSQTVTQPGHALKAFAAERGSNLTANARLSRVTHMDVSRRQIEQVVTLLAEFNRQ